MIMEPNSNPFGAPPSQMIGGNPFDSSRGGGRGGAPQQSPDPWAAAPPSYVNDSDSLAGYSTHSGVSNPFGAPPAQQSSYGAPPAQHSTYGSSPPRNSSLGAPHQEQAQTYCGYPFAAPAPPMFEATNAVVVAPMQSSPYAVAAPQYGHQQQLVAAPQQLQPWAAHPPQRHPNATSFDPFARSPPPAPAPSSYQPMSQSMESYQQPQQQQLEPYQQPQQQMEPYKQPQDEMEPYIVAPDPPSVTAPQIRKDPPPREDLDDLARPSETKELPDVVASPSGTTYPPQIEYGHRPDIHPDSEPSQAASPRNPYAPALAREAPPGASPLPKAELVRKRGFVLSRISFRTIVMKKWKQTYWVQYGPHTMLWFRSQADFDDWLNNPYHLQSERNFLIKLAVNFVHDLYKPNVRGYQVTQCRTKGYGNKIVRQFKLERWMDYGPTIAAAFGSYNPAEVDALREAMVECMRNTPLTGGIRATGAVRQPTSPPQHSREGDDDGSDFSGSGPSQAVKRSSYDELPKDKTIDPEPPKEAESVSEEADLLDVNNWDDVPVDVQNGPVSPNQAPPYGASPQQIQYAQTPFGSSQPASQHPYGQANSPYMVPQQQQQQSYSTAMVPTTSALQAYSGAPPPPSEHQLAYPPQQHQAYPPQQHQAYPPQQQQAYPSQQQAYPPQQPAPQSQGPWAAQPQIYLQPPQY